MNWHDSYVAHSAPDPEWVRASDSGEAVFRGGEEDTL